MKNIVHDLAVLRRLVRLCDLGARPPVIRSLLPTVPDAVITELWTERQGKRPPRGPLPHNVGFFLANPTRRLQSSFLLTVFDELRKSGAHDTDALVAAYMQFAQTFDVASQSSEDVISFDRGWFLIREFTTVRSLMLVKCDGCGARYIHRNLELINHRNCPVCKHIEEFDPARLDATEALHAHPSPLTVANLNTPTVPTAFPYPTVDKRQTVLPFEMALAS